MAIVVNGFYFLEFQLIPFETKVGTEATITSQGEHSTGDSTLLKCHSSLKKKTMEINKCYVSVT